VATGSSPTIRASNSGRSVFPIDQEEASFDLPAHGSASGIVRPGSGLWLGRVQAAIFWPPGCPPEASPRRFPLIPPDSRHAATASARRLRAQKATWAVSFDHFVGATVQRQRHRDATFCDFLPPGTEPAAIRSGLEGLVGSHLCCGIDGRFSIRTR
jgi:hypothetical protein